jgi:hypothetical protein
MNLTLAAIWRGSNTDLFLLPLSLWFFTEKAQAWGLNKIGFSPGPVITGLPETSLWKDIPFTGFYRDPRRWQMRKTFSSVFPLIYLLPIGLLLWSPSSLGTAHQKASPQPETSTSHLTPHRRSRASTGCRKSLWNAASVHPEQLGFLCFDKRRCFQQVRGIQMHNLELNLLQSGLCLLLHKCFHSTYCVLNPAIGLRETAKPMKSQFDGRDRQKQEMVQE